MGGPLTYLTVSPIYDILRIILHIYANITITKGDHSMTKSTGERRKYLRLEAPIGIRIITPQLAVDMPSVRNLSPLGLRFETKERVKDGDVLDVSLTLPEAKNSVHLQSKVVWHRDASGAKPELNDVGCEFIKIEEDNKNTFLKFFCDLIYGKIENIKKEGQS